MIMAYLDNSHDIMQAMYKAALAKSAVEKMGKLIEPVNFWTTVDRGEIELDSKNRFFLLDNGREIFCYDFLWIGSLSAFWDADITYRNLGMEDQIKDIQEFTWFIDNQALDLFLYPWNNFPSSWTPLRSR